MRATLSLPGVLPRVLLPGLLLLAGCTSDNVSWAFVSRFETGTTESGGAVIVINYNGTAMQGLGAEAVQVAGTDARGPVTVWLPYRADVAVLDRQGSVELRCPLLSPPRLELPGAFLGAPGTSAAALLVQVPDSSLVHPAAVGPGTLHVASAGTLLVLTSASAVVVFGERQEPEALPPNVLLSSANGDFLLLMPGNVTRALVAPPPPAIGQRIQQDPGRGSLRVLGPLRELLAELPAETVSLRHGVGGLFLTASLPAGLPGDPGGFELLMAQDNRYLLRIDQ